MAISYSKEQQQVIDHGTGNLLVSAAAGSGKTAVLVEHILRLITREENPVDIDRILIVTFTNAAAGEMRERIGKAIEAALEEQPENVHLQRQSALLHHAQITTIDSFCLFVLRNSFHEIGLDPGFRVGDQTELELLKQDIITDILEELLVEKDGSIDIYPLLDAIPGKNNVATLSDTILRLYNYAQSFPYPKDWLLKRKEDYVLPDSGNWEDFSWYELFQTTVKRMVESCLAENTQAMEVAADGDGPFAYLTALENDREFLEQLLSTPSSEWYGHLTGFKFTALSTKKQEGVSPEKKDLVKSLRDHIKKTVETLKKKYFGFTREQLEEQMAEICIQENILIDCTLLFGERFTQHKREKNLIDFSDMEHLALQILIKKEGEKLECSQVAREFQDYFYEVMIDEYQDSNQVQELILKAVSGEDTGNFNRFMVGDLKQSIYKFRMARPEIFLEKYETYSSDEGSLCQKIDLHTNFRSRQEVLTSANAVFEQIMTKHLGMVEYDENAALVPGAEYPETGSDYTTTMLLLQQENLDREEKVEQEARMIGMEIQNLVGKFWLREGKTDKTHLATYGDIAILLRSYSGADEIFQKALEEQGIPVILSTTSGYFNTKEVQHLMAFLQVLDNPRQDIPFYALLKSSLGEFSEEEIVRIRLEKKRTLYENCKKLVEQEAEITAESEEKSEFYKKTSVFLDKLDQYRALVPFTPIHILLQKYLRDTGYEESLLCMPGGEKRLSNVRMLLEKAESYEKTSYFGLFHFIRYVEKLQKYDLDSGASALGEEGCNAVRIMSIHKSKGLEFPICFVAGIHKKMNFQDASAPILWDGDYGLGMVYRNSEKRVRYNDLRHSLLGEKIILDSMGEELRCLYVAMTRAKEKLYLTGCVKDFEKEMEALQFLQHRRERKLPFHVLRKSTSYLQLLLTALVECNSSIQVRVIGEDTLEAEEVKHALEQNKDIEKLKQEYIKWKQEKERTTEEKSEFLERFLYTYEKPGLQNLYTKTSVSELKMKSMEVDAVDAYQLFEHKENYVPGFAKQGESMSKQKNVGALIGTAFHRTLELMDFDSVSDASSLQLFWDEVLQQNSMQKDMVELVGENKILSFLQSPLGQRMKKASQNHVLHREQPFVLGLPAKELDSAFPETEKVLIQGIIDAYFEEDGELVLVDYKTDAVSNGEELKKRYETQMAYYTKALEQLTGKPVKERILYSFRLQQEVVL